MSFANLQIRSGFANFFQPYSATILPISTSIEQSSLTKFAGGYWILQGNYKIRVDTKRLPRDNTDPQLGNVERDIMRMVCLYTPDQIVGIEDMIYRGQERVYGRDNDWAKSNWQSDIFITVIYHVVNEDPF